MSICELINLRLGSVLGAKKLFEKSRVPAKKVRNDCPKAVNPSYVHVRICIICGTLRLI